MNGPLLSPLLDRIHSSIGSLNEEVELVADKIKSAAELTLPILQPRNKEKTNQFFKDTTLKFLCERSKAAWKVWCEAGRPQSGPLFESKNGLHREVKKWVNHCAAVEERKHIRKREIMFKHKDNRRFRAPHRMKSRCSKLRVNSEVLSNKDNLLGAWADHFSKLSKSREHSEEGLKQLGNKINDLEIASLSNEEHILDVPFTLEEVKCAVEKLKPWKCCGPDGLSAEYLKWGGDSLHLWLLGIVNSIVDLEEIPPLFKLGSVCPIFKGGGKDPLLINNYRGITVNSVLSKVLEMLILSRLEPTLSEVDFPHLNQSAYRKHIGCTDAIFATQEFIARYISEGSTMYMYLFDLQKAFDSIEFPVLLDKLFSVGINGKRWRFIRNWYEGGKSFVHFDGSSSAPFPLERGVCQGSILSPTLFNIIMNPLLLTMEASHLGLSVNNLYGGTYLHTDDIRTLATSASTLQAQISDVLKFTSNNFLQINPAKCEIVSFAQVLGISMEP